MPRKLLLFAAVAVIGSMLALWLATRNSKSEPDHEQVASGEDRSRIADRDHAAAAHVQPSLPDQASRSGSGEVRPDMNRGQPRNPDPDRPLAATVTDTPRGSAVAKTEKPLEYDLPDGRHVRDFRKPEDRAPMDVPPSIHPPGGRRIPPALTQLFTDELVKHIRECKKSVPSGELGQKPRAEGQIVIAIKAEKAQVTSAVFTVTNISTATVAASAKACVEQKALTMAVPAANEADLDSYSINMSFAF